MAVAAGSDVVGEASEDVEVVDVTEALSEGSPEVVLVEPDVLPEVVLKLASEATTASTTVLETAPTKTWPQLLEGESGKPA